MKIFEFSKIVPKKAGFYVIFYKQPWNKGRQYREEWVYLHEPKHHYSNVYSYFTIYCNDQNNTPCDLGLYNWVNSYSGSCRGPDEWRRMTKDEEFDFRYLLYRFNRNPFYNDWDMELNKPVYGGGWHGKPKYFKRK